MDGVPGAWSFDPGQGVGTLPWLAELCRECQGGCVVERIDRTDLGIVKR